MSVSINLQYLNKFISDDELSKISQEIVDATAVLNSASGEGNDFLGWKDPASLNTPEQVEQMKACASRIICDSDIIIVAGIGGSYLGARATIEWLCSPSYNSVKKETPNILFVGNNLSASHISDTLSICEGKRVTVIVISKSGGTTETAVAFRILKDYMLRRYGKNYSKRIIAITDPVSGTLRKMSDDCDFKTFPIPSNVGGRFSVFTPVGLLPIACAGVDIDELLKGACDAATVLTSAPFKENPAMLYAAYRYCLYKKGYSVELYGGWDPSCTMTLEWLKQLFGESEGKRGKGLFPASATYSTDLHSLGQFVQQGSPILFETMLSFENDLLDVTVFDDPYDSDGLNFLSGKTLNDINHIAQHAVCQAHNDGGVPIISLSVPNRSAYEYGWMIFFFEYTCGIGGYTLNVNPFDQEGVEAYKKNMFAMLGKPGFEK